MPSPAAQAPDLEVAVIGAGFAGVAMAHALARGGKGKFAIFEKSGSAGGTWRDNIYPGCACDIPSHLYSLSFAPNPDWSRMFATQPEILAYFNDLIAKHGLNRHIRLNSRIETAVWSQDLGLWNLSLSDGRKISARNLVSAMGVLHHAAYPDIPGLADFAGTVVHTAHWDPALDLTGRKVAVIGTGASAVQVVPAIADVVGSMTVFQRTPPWIVPKFDRRFDDKMRDRFKRIPFARRLLRNRLFWAHEKRATGFTRQNPQALAKTEALCRGLLERQVKDPALRAALTPNYKVGCKRLIISSDYYPALQKPNVALETAGIERIEPGAIVTADGRHHEVDTIIIATGYDARRALAHVEIRGRDGRTLQETWDDNGMEAYLGTTVAGFPNFYVITGPNAGGGHNSQLFMIEAQVSYIMRALRHLGSKRKASSIEVRAASQQRFVREMDKRMDQSVWKGGGCMSWFLDPRTGRNNLLWPSYSTDYWIRTRRFRSGDYQSDA